MVGSEKCRWVGVLLLGVLASSSVAEHVTGNRPNIIFLMSDDQNTYSVGCYRVTASGAERDARGGNPDVQTPNMDKLGADGLIFDRHYATSAICMASRATVMTGMYEYKTGTNFGHGDMKPEVWARSYPILLREAGYAFPRGS